MGWNGAGSWARLFSWVADAAAGIDITASRMDADTNDITQNGLQNALTRDGQGVATANLPMAGFRHTNVGNGVARTDYASIGQAQDQTLSYTALSGTDTYTGNLTPAIPSYAIGAQYGVLITNPNTSTTPTVNLNGIGAQTIVNSDGTALFIGALNGEHTLRWDGTNFRVLNPRPAPLPANIVTGPGSSVNSDIALFNGATGVVIKDSGVLLAALAALAGTNTWTGANTFDAAVNVQNAAGATNPVALGQILESLGNPGYIGIPTTGGTLLIQWMFNVTTSTPTVFNYARAFSAAPLVVLVSPNATSTPRFAGVFSSSSASQVTIVCWDQTGAGIASDFSCIAIGLA